MIAFLPLASRPLQLRQLPYNLNVCPTSCRGALIESACLTTYANHCIALQLLTLHLTLIALQLTPIGQRPYRGLPYNLQ